MTPFWHPISAVLLDDPRVLATERLVRIMLAGSGETDVVYAGDRMWPAIRHGGRVRVAAASESEPRPGEVVLAAVGEGPDLLRVASVEKGNLVLRADADPGERIEVGRDRILGRARLPLGSRNRTTRWAARQWLDLVEAVRGAPDPAEDAADTVRAKYERQAPFYESAGGGDLDPSLLSWVRDSVADGGKILVVGSGTGREAFALAGAGYRVRGIDYAPAMVAASLREASRRGIEIPFEVADLRAHAEPPASLDAVFFTYDVYSFLPGRASRVAVLRRIRDWLGEQGIVFLSARLVRSWRGRSILALARLRGIGTGAEWGASHTRSIDARGDVRRSFVHCFHPGALQKEVASGGFRADGWLGGHLRLRRGSGAET